MFFKRKLSDRFRGRRFEDSLAELFAWQWLILDELATVRGELRTQMATSTMAREAVFALGAKIDALIAKVDGDGAIPADVQADLDAIEAEAKAQAEKMDAEDAVVVEPDPVVVDPGPDPIFNPNPSTF